MLFSLGIHRVFSCGKYAWHSELQADKPPKPLIRPEVHSQLTRSEPYVLSAISFSLDSVKTVSNRHRQPILAITTSTIGSADRHSSLTARETPTLLVETKPMRNARTQIQSKPTGRTNKHASTERIQTQSILTATLHIHE